MFKRILSLSIIVCFFINSLGPLPMAHADSILDLPKPGVMINLSPLYEPVIIKGLTVHKDNPFLFDFIVDAGQDDLSGTPLKNEGEKLIKYFLASLAIPDKDLWVNLSPYEKNRMIPDALGKTDMGRDLLEQDYILKQITASLIYPEKQLGKTFWATVYSKAREMYGTSQVPVNTFNKVWIVSDKAEVFEHDQTAFVVGCHLKVMLEEDYLALQKHQLPTRGHVPLTEGKGYVSPSTLPNELALEAKALQGNLRPPNTLASNIIRQIVLPELEKEVNTGKNFANLRQIFNSVILSSWYKRNLKQALLNQVYANRSKVRGIDLNDPTIKEQIYQQYLKAYKRGVFNYIKDDVSQGQSIPRKYFSGGEVLALDPKVLKGAAGITAFDRVHFNRDYDFNTGVNAGSGIAQAMAVNAAMRTADEESIVNGLSNSKEFKRNIKDVDAEILLGIVKRLHGVATQDSFKLFAELMEAILLPKKLRPNKAKKSFGVDSIRVQVAPQAFFDALAQQGIKGDAVNYKTVGLPSILGFHYQTGMGLLKRPRIILNEKALRLPVDELTELMVNEVALAAGLATSTAAILAKKSISPSELMTPKELDQVQADIEHMTSTRFWKSMGNQVLPLIVILANLVTLWASEKFGKDIAGKVSFAHAAHRVGYIGLGAHIAVSVLILMYVQEATDFLAGKKREISRKYIASRLALGAGVGLLAPAIGMGMGGDPFLMLGVMCAVGTPLIVKGAKSAFARFFTKSPPSLKTMATAAGFDTVFTSIVPAATALTTLIWGMDLTAHGHHKIVEEGLLFLWKFIGFAIIGGIFEWSTHATQQSDVTHRAELDNRGKETIEVPTELKEHANNDLTTKMMYAKVFALYTAYLLVGSLMPSGHLPDWMHLNNTLASLDAYSDTHPLALLGGAGSKNPLAFLPVTLTGGAIAAGFLARFPVLAAIRTNRLLPKKQEAPPAAENTTFSSKDEAKIIAATKDVIEKFVEQKGHAEIWKTINVVVSKGSFLKKGNDSLTFGVDPQPKISDLVEKVFDCISYTPLVGEKVRLAADFRAAFDAQGIIYQNMAMVAPIQIKKIKYKKTDVLQKSPVFRRRGRPDRSGEANDNAMKNIQGGIDLNTSSNMHWKIGKDGRGVEMSVNPAMLAKFQRNGIDWAKPVIFKMTPIISVWSLAGLQAPAR